MCCGSIKEAVSWVYKHNENNRVFGNFPNVHFLGYSVLENINIALKGVYSRVNIFKPDNKGNKFGDFCCIDISLFS